MATTPYTELANLHQSMVGPVPPKSRSGEGYGRFVGRVGALAVALGVGAAIANSPGIALADTGPSTASEASSPHSGTPNSGPAARPSAKSAIAGTTDSTSSSARGSGTSQPRSRGTSQIVATRSAATEVSSAAIAAQAGQTSAGTVVAPLSVPSASAIVRTPLTPVAPAQTPAVWTMLGWVRRELGHASAPALTAARTPAVAAQAVVMNQSVSTAAVSPLGTPQQIAAEKLAGETVNTLPVRVMKLVLRAGFLVAADQQFALVGGPDQENLGQLNEAVDEYAMGAAFQQQLLNPNAPTVVMQVAPPHTWYGQSVGGSRILYDNPDTIYRFMAVNAASSYVITGRFAGGIPADTNFSVLTGLSGTTAANLSGQDLQVAPDGTFTITVSGSPAAPGETNHLQLTSDSTLIATRNTLSDWDGQEPMSLSIQRISGPPNSLFSQMGGFAIPLLGPLVTKSPLLTTLVSLIPPLADPPPLLRGTVTVVVMALGLAMEPKYIAVATTDPTTGERTQPNVLRDPSRNAEFLATQLQSAGYFQLTDQQALVVTVNPGNAGYFVVPVTNDWTITDHYWDQQTSLNNAQAVANPDGTYTLVISPTDPGVANWVSTGGLNQGTISIRFQELDANSSTFPTVSSQVVSLDQLPAILPATTVYVTPAQRQAQIAARQTGFNNRFAPYPQP